jgi:sigma-E factor negative regulatory protein RseA
MNDTTHEQLSALMDGELPRNELRFLLRRVDGDAELARRWSRYQIVSAVLRRQYAAPATGEAFVAAVIGRLDERAAAGRQPLAGRMLRWAGGGAIAAAVAVFALVAVRPTGSENPSSVTAAAPAVASAQAPATVAAAPAPIGELHQPLLPQLAPAGFIDYAQPASYESIVPNYAPVARNPAGQLVDGSADGFVPYVLVVGSRQASGQAQAHPRREATAPQQ